MNSFPIAPPVVSLSRVTQAAQTAYHVYLMIVAVPVRIAPRDEPIDLEKVRLEMEIRDLKREVARLNGELEKRDLSIYLRREVARKTSIGIDLDFSKINK